MKQLLIDRLKRSWLLWPFIAALHFMVGWSMATLSEMMPALFMFTFLMNPWILLADLKQGYSRVVITLPFTPREIGRALWIFSVGLPSLSFALFSFVGLLFFHKGDLVLTKWVVNSANTALIFGSMFWFSSGSPTAAFVETSALRKLGRSCYRLFGIGLIGICVYLLLGFNESALKAFAFVLICSTMTVLGWQRAEGLVVDYGEMRGAAVVQESKTSNHKTPNGFGGIWYFFTSQTFGMISRAVWFFTVWVAFLAIIAIYSNHKLTWPIFIKSASQQLGTFQFWIFFSVFQPAFDALPHFRFLRSMPIKPRLLASVTLLTAFIPALSIAILFSLIQSTPAGQFRTFCGYLLGAAPVCVILVATIANAPKKFWPIVGGTVLFVATFVPVGFHLADYQLPLWFVFGLPSVSIALAHQSLVWLYTHSTSTYRIKPQDLRAMSGGR